MSMDATIKYISDLIAKVKKSSSLSQGKMKRCHLWAGSIVSYSVYPKRQYEGSIVFYVQHEGEIVLFYKAKVRRWFWLFEMLS